MNNLEVTDRGVRLRAVSGAATDDVLKEVSALQCRGFCVEVSLAAPCAEPVHRALSQLGARVLVEPVDSWVNRFEDGIEVFVIGPSRAAAATWRRLASLCGASVSDRLTDRHKLV